MFLSVAWDVYRLLNGLIANQAGVLGFGIWDLGFGDIFGGS
jgi:hypothetical protein